MTHIKDKWSRGDDGFENLTPTRHIKCKKKIEKKAWRNWYSQGTSKRSRGKKFLRIWHSQGMSEAR